MFLSVFLLGLLSALLAAQEELPRVRKSPLDETRAVRMDSLFLLQEGDKDLARILDSTFYDVHFKNLYQSQRGFLRSLVLFADGRQAVVMMEMDYSHEKTATSKTLVADPQSGAWLLVTRKFPTLGVGLGAAVAWQEEQGPEGRKRATLVAFDTRHIRVDFQPEAKVSPQDLAEKLFAQDPQLRELLLALLPLPGVPLVGEEDETGNEPLAISMFWYLAEYLGLKDVKPCPCRLKRLEVSIHNDEPEPAPPLAPELEKKFGKWASWRQLPSLRQP
jgi:hypothetical protein